LQNAEGDNQSIGARVLTAISGLSALSYQLRCLIRFYPPSKNQIAGCSAGGDIFAIKLIPHDPTEDFDCKVYRAGKGLPIY